MLEVHAYKEDRIRNSIFLPGAMNSSTRRTFFNFLGEKRDGCFADDFGVIV